MDLANFKAFAAFTVYLRDQTILVGPNNAGKSTLIAALRAAAGALRIGRARRAMSSMEIEGSSRVGHLLTGEQLALVEENLRHEFETQLPTTIALTWDLDRRIELRWPPGELPTCFASFVREDVTLTNPTEVRAAFPSIGVVPVLAPMESRERLLTTEHVESSVQTHRASMHARNHLYRLLLAKSETHENLFEEFKAFAAPLIAELELERPRRTLGEDWLDLDFRELGSRNTKEISWAGDGMQVWLQLLYHLFRLRDSRVTVLDEPDLFLHADIQRRLVRVLDRVEGQVITATHSPEVLAEARQDAVVWVSRERRQGKRAPDASLLYQLSEKLGTHFNLRLARALRAQLVVFVEGKDMRILRNLAGRLDAQAVLNETAIAVIPLEGFDRWEHVEPFQWMVGAFLDNTVKVLVVLDRDYRDEDAVGDVLQRLQAVGVSGHVWARHELENYLVDPGAISRISGSPIGWVRAALANVADSFEDEVRAGFERARIDWGRRRETPAESKQNAQARFSEAWEVSENRLALAPGKELISRLNHMLDVNKFKTVSPRRLSRSVRADDIPEELAQFVWEIDSQATQQRAALGH